MSTTVSLSRLLQHPTEVAALVADDDVVLGRRGADDLYLSTRERHDQEAQGLRITTTALAALARTHPDLAADALTETLPWVAWLPPGEKLACLHELLEDLRAGADTDHLRPFFLDLAAWRTTAIAWSDPDLTRALSTDHSPDDSAGAFEDGGGGGVMTAEESLVPRPRG